MPVRFHLKNRRFGYISAPYCPHTHTHTPFNSHFPGEPGLAGCPLNSPSPFIPELCIILGQTKTFRGILNRILLYIITTPYCPIDTKFGGNQQNCICTTFSFLALLCIVMLICICRIKKLPNVNVK